MNSSFIDNSSRNTLSNLYLFTLTTETENVKLSKLSPYKTITIGAVVEVEKDTFCVPTTQILSQCIGSGKVDTLTMD